MSFIAGVVSTGEAPISSRTRTALTDAVPDPPGTLHTFDFPFARIVKVDLGVFPDPGCHHEEDGVTVLAGHPFFGSASRDIHARPLRGASTLHSSRGNATTRLALSARGSWSAARYDGVERELTIIADRTAVRPVYWWTDGELAVFSSVFSLMEHLPFLSLELDLQGVLESLTLGYSLADRTAYRNVKRIMGGEMVTFRAAGLSRSVYFRWGDLPARSPDLSKRAEVVLSRLRQAVALRAADRPSAVTFLSGGLDSRVVNYLLAENGVRIHSLSLAPPDSMDGAFSESFAKLIGTRHLTRSDLGGARPDFASSLSKAWQDDPVWGSSGSLRELLPAWSGDGGSVCGGWVYMTPTIVSAMRASRWDDAIQEFCQRWCSRLPEGDFVAKSRHWLRSAIPNGILHELTRHDCEDPARSFFLFLVSNDQRRHLDHYFERILTHQVEFWLPFFDTEFLQIALTVPVDEGLGHRFYLSWFDQLPEVVREVPWQTYPGHIPCPLPIPTALWSQWQAPARSDTKPQRWPRTHDGLGMLFRRGFPSPVLRRQRFLLRFLLHQLRLRDSEGAFRILFSIRHHWGVSGRHSLPWLEGLGRP